MFLWSKRGNKSPAAPAAAGREREREVPVQKVDRIKPVRNLVTRPAVYGGSRRNKQRGRGGSSSAAGGVPLAPPRVAGSSGGGGAAAARGEDIDRKSSEYINKVRRMWLHSHNHKTAAGVAGHQ